MNLYLEELDEYREKQEGVPFNYSFGGGTQGLIETNTVNGPDIKDENLVVEDNFRRYLSRVVFLNLNYMDVH